jgi:hypothetical protein
MRGYKAVSAICLLALALVGCTQYWMKPDTNIRQTAKDLSDCRIQGNQGGQKEFTPMQIEGPCMTAKGYALSNQPPSP